MVTWRESVFVAGNRCLLLMQRLVVLWALIFSAGCYSLAKSTVNKESVMPSSLQAVANESLSRNDRATGAVMGLLVGDALGLGTHWYYDLDALHRDHGEWVDHYVDPEPDSDHDFAKVSKLRYDQGLRAGDVSQTGQIYTLLLQSLVEKEGLNTGDFFHRLDAFFTTLNGESYNGRYTESLIRVLWQKRRDGLAWDNPAMGTGQDVSDGAQYSVLLAALYSEPQDLVEQGDKLLRVFFSEPSARGNQLVFALVVQALINGIAVDDLDVYLRNLTRNPVIYQKVGGYDRFLTPGYGRVAQQPNLVRIDKPQYISHVYGLDCAFSHLVPASYYLLYRFPTNFEKATLSASNGGGNNMARAALTGALLGAANGVSGIPMRFLRDLRDSEKLQTLAASLAKQAQ